MCVRDRGSSRLLPRLLDLSPVQANRRARRAPAHLFIPKLDAFYYPSPSSQVHRPRRTTGFYYLPELQFLVCAVAKVNHYSFEAHRSVLDTNLKLSKPSFGTSQR